MGWWGNRAANRIRRGPGALGPRARKGPKGPKGRKGPGPPTGAHWAHWGPFLGPIFIILICCRTQLRPMQAIQFLGEVRLQIFYPPAQHKQSVSAGLKLGLLKTKLRPTSSEQGPFWRPKASKTRVLSFNVPFSPCWSRKRQSG
mgnify:CR=1 FL=1